MPWCINNARIINKNRNLNGRDSVSKVSLIKGAFSGVHIPFSGTHTRTHKGRTHCQRDTD